ncbi:MAG: hypothetical protein RLY97_598, partial [Pseudomonadota bacterium]
MKMFQRNAMISLAISAVFMVAVWGSYGAFSGKARAAEQAQIAQPTAQITAMRRLSESQYRNSIADIFGPDISVAGRFEPIVRPA